MNKSILLTSATILTLVISSQSGADTACPSNESVCGPNCCYSVDDNNNLVLRALSASDDGYDADANGGKANVNDVQFSPEYHDNVPTYNNVTFKGDFDTIKGAFYVDLAEGGGFTGNLTFEGKVREISSDAFCGAMRGDLKRSLDLTLTGVEVIGSYAFYKAKLTDVLTLPDSLTTIGESAFDGMSGVTSMTIPDSVATIGDIAFFNTSLTNVTCKGDETSCATTISALRYGGYFGTVSYATENQCTGNYGWTGTSCARKDENGNIVCASGYADYKNKCWAELPFAKKHWTPTEANEWLNDENNTVTITFKK